VKDLLRIDDLTRDDLDLLVDLAAESRHNQRVAHRLLKEETVLIHTDRGCAPALDRVALVAAAARLGAVPMLTTSDDLALRPADWLRDAANAVSSWVRLVVLRVADDDVVQRAASAASVPVANAGSDEHNPVQAIADLATISARFGSLAGVRVAFVGAGCAAANSLAGACALAGVDFVAATPPGYELAADPFAAAEELAQRSGAVVLATHDPYRVDEGLMAMADPDAMLLHPLPVRRGVEVATPVVDGGRSMVFEEAENRMHAAMAVMRALAGRRLVGRRRTAFASVA